MAEHRLWVEHRRHGVVTIGDQGSAPAGITTLALSGCTATVDPTHPRELPSLVVFDAEAALPTVERLCGQRVARAVAEVSRRDPGAGLHADAEPGPDVASLVQLGHVRWCRDHSPLACDPTLLQLEDLVLVGQLREVLEQEEAWEDDLLALASLLLDFTAEDDMHLDGVGELVRSALELVANELPVTNVVVGAAAARLREWALAPTETMVAVDVDWVVDGLAPALAAVAGGEHYAGSSSLDWPDVPRGHISMEEGAVHWDVELDRGRARVSVAVAAEPPPIPHPGLEGPVRQMLAQLAFDVHLVDLPFPVMSGMLELDPLLHTWVGTIEVDGAQAELLETAITEGRPVDVRVRTTALTPRRDRRITEAERWSARGVSALRLHGAEPESGLLDSAAAAWRRAAFLWNAVGDTESEAVAEALAAAAAGPAGDDAQVFGTTLAERWLAVSGDTGAET